MEAGVRGGRATGRTSSQPPLLERERELGVLGAAIDAARVGNGSFALIEAGAGLGKSRLLAAGADLATTRGLRVLRAAGNELEGEFAFGLVLQLLEHELPDGRAERDSLFQGAAALARPLLERGDSASADGTEFPLLHGLYWLVSNLAERQPLLVAVDDLHWADRSSLSVLLYLSQRLDGLPVALTAALRPHEPSVAEDVLAALRARPGAASVRPPALTANGVDALVRLRFPESTPEFTRACWGLTSGNPFLLTELLRGVQERGEEPSAATGGQLAGLAPDSVLRSVVARVRRVAPGASELARAVAILGPRADLDVVVKLSGLDRPAARQATDALADSEVLRAGDPLAFVHPLLREMIYRDVPEAMRAAAHARAARLLAAGGAGPDVVAAHLLLAERAGDEWAVEALERAATVALREGAPRSAVTYLQRALSEPPVPARRPVVLLELGRAETAAGESRAAERLQQAVELTVGAVERGRATLDLAQALHSLGRYVDAADAIDRALADLDGADEDLARELEATWLSVARLAPRLRDKAVERLASMVERSPGDSHAERLLLGDTDQAHELAEDELRLAERFGAPRPIGVALRAKGIIEGKATGVEILRKAVSILEKSPAVLEHARAMVDLGSALRRASGKAEARDHLRQALAITDRLGLIAIGRRAVEELQAAGARPRRRELVGVHSLTPSERRVAAMAAEGMTNREIAQDLFVTVKAVQWHLGNSYRKLGVAGRGELAAVFASERASASSRLPS